MSCDLRDKFSFCVRDDPDGPFVRVPAFFNSQGLRIVAYTAPSINHTPRRGRAFPFADASANQGRGPAAGRADRALAGIGQDREGHRAGRGVTGERVRPRSRCLLFGVEQTSRWRTATSQFDPEHILGLVASSLWSDLGRRVVADNFPVVILSNDHLLLFRLQMPRHRSDR